MPIRHIREVRPKTSVTRVIALRNWLIQPLERSHRYMLSDDRILAIGIKWGRKEALLAICHLKRTGVPIKKVISTCSTLSTLISTIPSLSRGQAPLRRASTTELLGPPRVPCPRKLADSWGPVSARRIQRSIQWLSKSRRTIQASLESVRILRSNSLTMRRSLHLWSMRQS